MPGIIIMPQCACSAQFAYTVAEPKKTNLLMRLPGLCNVCNRLFNCINSGFRIGLFLFFEL